MINGISTWAEHIIIAVIIGTILEMILPNGNSKKYIKTVIGIFILYTIISPGIKLITKEEFKIDYTEYEKYFTKAEEARSLENEANDVTNKILENTYKEEIKSKIKKDIGDLGFFVSNIFLNTNIQTGEISKLDISVNKEKEERTYTNSIVVNKIEIGDAKEKLENNLSRQQIENIKEKLVQNYGIKYEEIRINSI